MGWSCLMPGVPAVAKAPGWGRTRGFKLHSRKLACTHPWGWNRGSLGEQSCLQTHSGLPIQSPDWRLCDLGQVPPHPGSWSLSSSVCEIHLLSVPSCCIATFSPSAPLSLCLKVWTLLVPEVLVHRTLLFHASVSPPKPFLPREEGSRIELGGMACRD